MTFVVGLAEGQKNYLVLGVLVSTAAVSLMVSNVIFVSDGLSSILSTRYGDKGNDLVSDEVTTRDCFKGIISLFLRKILPREDSVIVHGIT